MSTTAERYQKNVIDGINRAFGDLEIGPGIAGAELKSGKLPILVRALERHVAGNGVSMGPSTGFSLTIGDRTANFSGEGRWIENVKAAVEYTPQQWQQIKDKRPDKYAAFCRGIIGEAELFAVDELKTNVADQADSGLLGTNKPQPAGAKK